jgi:hypothetical protein
MHHNTTSRWHAVHHSKHGSTAALQCCQQLVQQWIKWSALLPAFDRVMTQCTSDKYYQSICNSAAVSECTAVLGGNNSGKVMRQYDEAKQTVLIRCLTQI